MELRVQSQSSEEEADRGQDPERLVRSLDIKICAFPYNLLPTHDPFNKCHKVILDTIYSKYTIKL